MGVSQCFAVYNTLLNKKYVLTLEGNIKIELFFSKKNLKHLLGLHKLTDIELVSKRSGAVVYQLIKNETINDALLQSSIQYNKIAERILYFYLIPILLNSKIIIDFDPQKIPDAYVSKLKKTDYVLYKYIDGNTIAHLTLSAAGFQKYYPETFFVEHSKMYLSDQKLLDVLRVDIIEM